MEWLHGLGLPTKGEFSYKGWVWPHMLIVTTGFRYNCKGLGLATKVGYGYKG
jgi:hypothetical protein